MMEQIIQSESYLPYQDDIKMEFKYSYQAIQSVGMSVQLFLYWKNENT